MKTDISVPSSSESASSSSSSDSSDDPKSKRERSPLSKVLPTDRIAFDKQVAILRAFAAVYAANNAQPVTPEQAGEVTTPKFSGSTITQAIGFFCDIGILERLEKGGLKPSQELIEYNDACQWDESEARFKLRPIFEKTWFARCLIPRLQLTTPPKQTCLSLLASESKATTEHQERLENLLNFLELATIVSLAGGSIKLIQNKTNVTGDVPNPQKTSQQTPPTQEDEHTLYLDKSKQRKVVIQAPLEISRAEYDRLCKWLAVALIIDEPGQK